MTSQKLKILKLTLSKKPFEVTATGEKSLEFRLPSKWILSRLVDKKGKPKHYDLIEYRNGYRKNAPSVTLEYRGFSLYNFEKDYHKTYSNGLAVEVKKTDVVIEQGWIVSGQNFE